MCILAAVCLCACLCFCGRVLHPYIFLTSGWSLTGHALHTVPSGCVCVCVCVAFLLHTDIFFFTLCGLGLNLNHPTCPSAVLFNTPALSLSQLLSVSCVRPRSLSPHLHPAHRAVATSPYHTISVSLCLFHYLLHLLAHYCVLCVCRYNAPRGSALHRHWHVVDVSAQFTVSLQLQRLTVFISPPTYHHVPKMCLLPVCLWHN